MLVHPDNTPVCESAEIITRIESDFDGTTSLAPQTEEHTARYQKLYDMHEAWDVEPYSIGYMIHETFMGNMFKYMAMSANEKLQKKIDAGNLSPEMKDLMIEKQVFKVNQTNEVADLNAI